MHRSRGNLGRHGVSHVGELQSGDNRTALVNKELRVALVETDEKKKLLIEAYVYYHGCRPNGKDLRKWRKYLQQNPDRAESILTSMEKKNALANNPNVFTRDSLPVASSEVEIQAGNPLPSNSPSETV